MSCLRVRRALFLLGTLSALAGSASLTGCNESAADNAAARTADPAEIATRQRVQIVKVRRGQLGATDRASGIVHAFHKARVTSETRARVVGRAVEAGDRVEAGQQLIELDATRLELEVRHAEATLRARSSDLAHARREYERGEQLVAQKAISEQRRDDLRHALDSARDAQALATVSRDTARRNLEDASIRAPFAGTVEALAVDVGDYVSPGSPVATVVDLSRARVFVGVTAQEAARLGGSDTASVQFTALGGGEVVAQLKSVGSVASERDGTYSVELWIDDLPKGLRDGMVASVRLPSGTQDAGLLAPRAALMRRSGQPEVFAVEHKGDEQFASLRAVRTGRSSGDWIEVLEGLSEGDEVIVDGQFALRDGAAILVDSQTARAR